MFFSFFTKHAQEGLSALSWAIRQGQSGCLSLLVEGGAKLNVHTNVRGADSGFLVIHFIGVNCGQILCFVAQSHP